MTSNLPSSLVRFEAELQDAIRRDRRAWRPTLRRGFVPRVAVAGLAAAAIALGVLNFLPGSGDSVVQRATAALAVQGGAVLHVDVVGTQVAPDGSVATWEEESWQQQSKPFDRREIETNSAGPSAETAVHDGVTQLYDAARNTIYTTPTSTGRRSLPDPAPIVSKIIANLARSGTSEGVEPAPKGSGQTDATPSLRDGLVSLLRSGQALDRGKTTVEGQAAIAIGSTDGSMTYFVDAATYYPIRLEFAKNGWSMTLRFHAFEQLPSSDSSLFDLQTQHPGSHLDDTAAAYAAAQERLNRTS